MQQIQSFKEYRTFIEKRANEAVEEIKTGNSETVKNKLHELYEHRSFINEPVISEQIVKASSSIKDNKVNQREARRLREQLNYSQKPIKIDFYPFFGTL